jgi:hypothetical protein
MDRYTAIERQHGGPVRRTTTEAQTESGVSTHPLLQLQRQIGNAQIARLLAQREGPADEEEVAMQRVDRASDEEELAMLRVQRAGEEDELQMDRLQRADEEEEPIQAQRVQRQTPDEEEVMQAQRVQRAGPEEEEIQMDRLERTEEDEEMQMMRGDAQREPEVGLAGGPISAGLADRINGQRGGGAPLDEGTRTTMEAGFGTSFEDVRVHTGSEAAELNRSIAGRAFTTGKDVFLGESASQTDSHLMAHELTHVVQQRDMSGSGGPMSVTAAGDAHEQQAEAAATAVTSGGSAPIAATRLHAE